MPDPGPGTPFERMEQAFLQLTATPEGKALYGDPENGASILQAWRTVQLIGGDPPVCLVAAQHADQAHGIPDPVRLPTPQLMQAVRSLLAQGRVQVFLFTGKQGHSVVLLGHDAATGRFALHDPWDLAKLEPLIRKAGRPELLVESLLPGAVDRGRGHPGGRWTLAEADLARMLVAAFAQPAQWARHKGAAIGVSYAALRASEFWDRFRLREVFREGSGDEAMVAVAPGSFREHLEIRLDLRGDRVTHAALALRRAWLQGSPLPRQLAAAFLEAFCPPPAAEEAAGLAELVRRLADPDFLAWARTCPPAVQAFGAAFMAGEPPARLPLPFCTLGVGDEPTDNGPWLVVRYSLP